MEGILVGLFIFINICIRVPIRIAMHFKQDSDRLGKIDLWLTIITALIFEIMMIYAYSIGEITTGSLIVISIIFFVPAFLFFLVLVKPGNDNEYWNELYLRTQQKPERDDYGFCKENPIWTGTIPFYFSHIYTKDGNPVSWKQGEKIKLEENGGFSSLNGFNGCELHKYYVLSRGDIIDEFYICTKSGLDNMKIWHAPKGYKFEP